MSAAAVLSMMLDVDPLIETVPYRDTFEASAEVIARVSADSPLFTGASGPARTEALLVSLGWYEGGLKQNAEGDCDQTNPKTGMCVTGSKPHSFCMFQIGESNFATLRTTKTDIQNSFETCTRMAVRMLHVSFGVCRNHPLEELLGQYASGGQGCGGPQGQGLKKSRSRVLFAKRLLERLAARERERDQTD